MNIKAKKQQAGFSLIELLVSISLFMVVSTISVGTLLMLIDANRKAQNMQEAMTNLAFALDSMTREIRTGDSYYCTSANAVENSVPNSSAVRNCSQNTALSIVEGGSSLTAGSGGERVTYRLSGGVLQRRIGSGSWDAITSDTVEIEAMHFKVHGAGKFLNGGNRRPPTATIFIEGQAGDVPGIDTSFSMQTTVTKRVLDL